jgi:predicted O-methyltransferase YrrM
LRDWPLAGQIGGVNPLSRIGPYVYAAAHCYNAAWELLVSGHSRRIAVRDAARLRLRFPFLTDYPRLSAAARAHLAPAYARYTATVSPAPISISLELAVFLRVLCEQTHPQSILDLGSGFSSYVFRCYARESVPVGFPAPPPVYSLDQSRRWLEKTRVFLDQQHLDTRHLATWEDLRAAQPAPTFDLILHDIATLDVRLAMLDDVIRCCRPGGGLIVIDDMHVPGYRRAVLRALTRQQLAVFSLRSFTRKRLRYSYLVAL